jgi:hypothetical protein
MGVSVAESRWKLLKTVFKLPPYTLAGFDLTIHSYTRRWRYPADAYIPTYTTPPGPEKILYDEPWRRSIVDIASASRKEDPGFESRQGVKFLGLYNIAVLLSKICIVIHVVQSWK